MIIFDQDSKPIILDNILSPIKTSSFWVLDLELQDFTLASLSILEERICPSLKIRWRQYQDAYPRQTSGSPWRTAFHGKAGSPSTACSTARATWRLVPPVRTVRQQLRCLGVVDTPLQTSRLVGASGATGRRPVQSASWPARRVAA